MPSARARDFLAILLTSLTCLLPMQRSLTERPAPGLPHIALRFLGRIRGQTRAPAPESPDQLCQESGLSDRQPDHPLDRQAQSLSEPAYLSQVSLTFLARPLPCRIFVLRC